MKLTEQAVLKALGQMATGGVSRASSTEIAAATGGSLATAKRLLEKMVVDGKLSRSGRARATRYELDKEFSGAPSDTSMATGPDERAQVPWSAASIALLARLAEPIGARRPTTYQRKFVDDYSPNESSLLPPRLARDLGDAGRMRDQQPAATYARKMLEQLLIDLSWSSSRLEGNRYSLLATRELFATGLPAGDMDALMLVNHKRAIEFLVDAVPEYGLTTALVRNLHALLMHDLLADSAALGAIRHKVVNIGDTVYVPTQVPSLIEEMFDAVIAKARRVKNPAEAAFFVWVNLAYLQPFEDGNKRTSRLTANVPLMLYNCAPLSFLDVTPADYAQAMLGVYEQRDVSAAVDLFEWTYRRSVEKYKVVLESMEAPDPVRARYRTALNDAVQLVVRERNTAREAAASLGLSETAAPGFETLLASELQSLEIYNCARYRLSMSTVEAWIAKGRPQ